MVPLSLLPSFATVGFSEFFHLGRALRCHLPISGGRIIHLVVVYGFQGASTDSEKLRLTEKLLDAVLCELAVVASGQPCLIVGDLNVELVRVPCLLKGLIAGRWFDLQSSWAAASGVDPLPTCCRTFGSCGVVTERFHSWLSSCCLFVGGVFGSSGSMDLASLCC